MGIARQYHHRQHGFQNTQADFRKLAAEFQHLTICDAAVTTRQHFPRMKVEKVICHAIARLMRNELVDDTRVAAKGDERRRIVAQHRSKMLRSAKQLRFLPHLHFIQRG